MIKCLVLDVDGTLTDGGIYIASDKTEYKRFQAKDGLIVRVLPEIGIKTVILTGRDSPLTLIRAEDLKISYIFQGVIDKKLSLNQFFFENNLDYSEIAYIGDDLNDYRAMLLCGFKACPADSATEIKTIADYVSPCNGGDGAVRDICEKILKDNGLWEDFLKLWM
ncbi:MAG: HAD hydrolase family protein [Oscillospiraceae bacterium]|jgi:3-deoxy-D-manno-octulosonate 8-phosphate phosphatase (KDO 8-P phosphatase)|nr:HAD hydrolase family protein [Oscillospiraceae bacterium]